MLDRVAFQFVTESDPLSVIDDGERAHPQAGGVLFRLQDLFLLLQYCAKALQSFRSVLSNCSWRTASERNRGGSDGAECSDKNLCNFGWQAIAYVACHLRRRGQFEGLEYLKNRILRTAFRAIQKQRALSEKVFLVSTQILFPRFSFSILAQQPKTYRDFSRNAHGLFLRALLDIQGLLDTFAFATERSIYCIYRRPFSFGGWGIQ